MKFQSVLLGLSVASATSGTAVAGAIPEREIIESLLTNNGFLMLPSGSWNQSVDSNLKLMPHQPISSYENGHAEP